MKTPRDTSAVPAAFADSVCQMRTDIPEGRDLPGKPDQIDEPEVELARLVMKDHHAKQPAECAADESEER